MSSFYNLLKIIATTSVFWSIKRFIRSYIKMRKLFLIILTVFIANCLSLGQVFAQGIVKTRSTSVNARIGEFNLAVSGMAFPNAIVSLIFDNLTMATTNADSQGNFNFSLIPIKKGFASFCLNAVDTGGSNASEICFDITPATADVVMDNIFLPPTGISTVYEVGSDGDLFISGYTVPGAVVTIAFDNGDIYTTIADSTGRYSFNLKNLKLGSYKITVKAGYGYKESASKSARLNVLSPFSALDKDARNLLRSNWLILAFLILIIPVIILFLWRFFLCKKKQKKKKSL